MTRPHRTFTAHEADRLRDLDGLRLASFRQRATAFIVDLGIVLVIYIAVSLPSALSKLGETGGDIAIQFNPFHGLWSMVAVVLYFGLLTYWGKGRTPGKRLARIRVVSTAHDHLSLWHCVERALGYGASALEGGFGFMQYFIHVNHRTVHDRIAETVVVDERQQ